jgi:predicted HAD superfamily hydrolase
MLGLFKKNHINKFTRKNVDVSDDNYALIEKNFDIKFYINKFNIDISTIDPLVHFCLFGEAENKYPNESFWIDWYLNEYNDVRNARISPFLHYLLHGKDEGRFQNQFEKDDFIMKKNIEQAFQKTSIDENLNIFISEIEENDRLFIEYLYDGKRGCFNDCNIDSDIKLLSLDIWDTVLRRKCHPDEIKYSSARYLYLNYLYQLKPAFRNLQALFVSRKKNEDLSSLTNDYEFRYEDAINGWLIQVFEIGTKSNEFQKIKNELLEYELKAELRSTEKDFALDQFLNKTKFPQIIFASDFYMPNNFLQKLLRKNNMAHHFITGYVSCDLVKNKRSGILYEHILDEFNVSAYEVMHIGDNQHADIVIPKNKGIDTFHYYDEHENNLHQWFYDAFLDKQQGKSHLHGKRLYALALQDAKNKNLNDLELIGSKLALLVIGYILHVIEEAKKLKVDTIYFFTREGIFLKEIYDLVTENDPYFSTYPKSELLEVSRLATFGPSVELFTTDNLMRLWNQYSVQTPQAFCASLNIDNTESKVLFEGFGFKYDKIIKYPWKNSNFLKLLESSRFKSIVNKYIMPQRNNLLSYLHSKGLNQGQSASMIVDLGWRGTIQDNISYLVTEHIHGCYLGLFPYLNKQEKVSKSGWLFDNNIDPFDWSNHEVGPIEMLFNSLGGSAVGYVNIDGNINVLKKEELSEDAVFYKYTQYFQNGIKAVLHNIVDYVSIHALDSSDLKQISRQIVNSLLTNPPSKFAEAFFDLTHNETFGTGKYQKMEISSDFIKELGSKHGSDLHSFVSHFMSEIRWKEGFFNIESIHNSIISVQNDLTNTPLDFYNRTILQSKKCNFKVALYVPAPIVGSGGHRTIFNMARKFIEAGCDVFCFLESEGAGIDAVYDYLGDKKAFVYVGWPEYIQFDMAIATIAHSSEVVSNLKNVKHKAYLVQDFEAWFNPIGDTYTINENSYTYGNLHFTVGKFLTHLLQHQYGANAIPAGLGIDTNIYFDKHENRENSIAFLYQPEKFRRNPLLAIEALEIVKKKYPDTKIYVYGSNADINLNFEVENLGLVTELTKLNELYNKCKVGLCISMTNPSRIPFEFMASGVVAVDVYRYNNLLDYPSGTIKLAYQSSESIAEAIIQILSDSVEYQNRKQSGIDFASTRTLNWEMDSFINNALRIMNDMNIDSYNVISEYDEAPVISIKDNRNEVHKFCQWQKKLAFNKV